MTITSDHDLYIQGTQAACGWALHHLPTENHRVTGMPLPILTWLIGAASPDLSGLAITEDAVRQWADHLGTEVTETRAGGVMHLETRGIAYGMPVRVWTQTPVPVPPTTEV